MYKRLWQGRQGVFGHLKTTYWDDVREACASYLLDRIEALFQAQETPVVFSAHRLAGELQRDPKAQAVAEVYTGESAPDLERLVTDLVNAEGVPYLAALRYTDTGLEKYAIWCETWSLQRQEDAGDKVSDIPVPPKYATPDFRHPSFWTHRGKLDVPKERFILYPGAETEGDSSPLVGWAGWDHLQKATALSGVYQDRKTSEGFEAEKLIPLLAGLEELVPWLIQWHNASSEAYGGLRLGDYFRDFTAGEARSLDCSTQDLEAWRPPSAKRGRKGSGVAKKPAPALSPEVLLAAFTPGAEMAQKDLAKSLGVSSAAVGKVAKVAIEAGNLVQTSGRPKRYRLAPTQESSS